MGKPNSKDLTQKHLKANLHYNPHSGIWTWIKPRPKVNVGQQAGSKNLRGYYYIGFEGKNYRSSRLAWLYMTGKWPQQEIDHINRKLDDDRWKNLRKASRAENNRNQVKRKDNTVGYTGVHWCNTWHKYIAQISIDGKRTKLGSF